MTNRPTPETFARYSYYLALASSIIVLIGFVIILIQMLTLIQRPLSETLINIVWLALLTSGAGAFLAYAARSDFRRNPGTPEAARHARIGWRVNLGALSVLAVMALFKIVASLLSGPQ